MKTSFKINFFSQFIIKLILILILITSTLMAAENFFEEKDEERARVLFLQVKCFVCEGQVIESSNTQVAFEMRKLIRSKIKEGLTDTEIKNYLVNNYGDEILTSPPLNHFTIALWLLPVISFIVGLLYIACRKKLA